MKRQTVKISASMPQQLLAAALNRAPSGEGVSAVVQRALTFYVSHGRTDDMESLFPNKLEVPGP